MKAKEKHWIQHVPESLVDLMERECEHGRKVVNVLLTCPW